MGYKQDVDQWKEKGGQVSVRGWLRGEKKSENKTYPWCSLPGIQFTSHSSGPYAHIWSVVNRCVFCEVTAAFSNSGANHNTELLYPALYLCFP